MNISFNTVKSYACICASAAFFGWGAGGNDYLGFFTLSALLMIASALFSVAHSLGDDDGTS